MEKLREEHETYQEEQALVVAVAVPVLAAVHRDLALVVAVASIAQEVFHLQKDAVGLLATGCDAAGLLLVGRAAAVCAPMARCRSSSAVVAMITPITITSPSVA